MLPPIRGSQSASPTFLDKIADAPSDVGAVTSSPCTRISGEKQMALGEMEVIWQRKLTAPRIYPSQVCLDAVSSWGPAKAQSPDSPTGKWRVGQGEPGRQKLSGGQGRACGGQQERPSPGLRDRARHLQRLRSRWNPAPRKNLLSGKGSR